MKLTGLRPATYRRSVGRTDDDAVGADIHLYLEFREKSGHYEAVSDGEFELPRDYELFCALAGVRCRGGAERTARGIPTDVSAVIATAYFVPVVSDEGAAGWGIGEHFNLEQAERHVASGSSLWKPESCTSPTLPSEHGYISDPDRHSASWLLATEMREALASLPTNPDDSRLRIRQILAFAEMLEQQGPGPARFVFWFDN